MGVSGFIQCRNKIVLKYFGKRKKCIFALHHKGFGLPVVCFKGLCNAAPFFI